MGAIILPHPAATASRSLLGLAFVWLTASALPGQSIGLPWSGLGHDAQHTAVSQVAAQPLQHILWQTPVDLDPQYSGSELLIHYGSPLITRQNTVLIPVKTGATQGFQVEARKGTDGGLVWKQATDYILPAASWVPAYGICLTPKNRVYFAGAGGTVYYRDAPDSATAPPGGSGQLAFYGLDNYNASQSAFNSSVKINTPITSDRYGNIYFGFQVSGTTSPALQSGLARIAEDGTGSWVSATVMAGDAAIAKVVHNCAPALSNDHKTLYVAVSFGDFSGGYLVSVDSRTLAPVAHVRLHDVLTPVNDAQLPDDGTATPAVGPDGDVFFGVFENPFYSNHLRGWLLHFNKDLSQNKIPGAFGWDDTPSIVPASIIPSYHGASKYLVFCKYNNYAQAGGDGINKVAVLDPNSSMTDPISGATVMKEVLTKAGITPDDDLPGVREWCVNTVAIDPITKCAIVSSEDGCTYRWDFTTNTLSQTVILTDGIGEAYTPTVIGVDGTVYAIANATLFALGQ